MPFSTWASVSFDSGRPLVAICEVGLWECSNGGDEHRLVKRREGSPLKDKEFEAERVVRLIPRYCDPTVNMVGVRGRGWRVCGRLLDGVCTFEIFMCSSLHRCAVMVRETGLTVLCVQR